MTRLTTAVAALAIVGGLSAQAQTAAPGAQQPQAQQSQPMSSPGSMPGHQGPADKDYMQAMERMQQNMPKQMSGDADKDFARMMLPHHQSAVDMAKAQLQHGKDPMLRKMAEDIVRSQEKEIAELKEWLSKHK